MTVRSPLVDVGGREGELPAGDSLANTFAPTYIAPAGVFSVPLNTQTAFDIAPTVDGSLVIDGDALFPSGLSYVGPGQVSGVLPLANGGTGTTGLAASAFADTTNAANISSGTLNIARLPSALATPLAGGRLTLLSGTSRPTTDQIGKTSVLYTPDIHDLIGIYNGTSWDILTFSETALALGTVTSGLPYDVFAYNNSGSLGLEMLAWTSLSARATALVKQDGVWCKTGALTRRWVGTFVTTSTTTTEDSLSSKLYLFNANNRRARTLLKTDSSKATYSGNAWRAWANDQTTYQLAVFNADPADMSYNVFMYSSVPSGIVNAGVVVDVAPTSLTASAYENLGLGRVCYSGTFATGQHYIVPVEYNFPGGGTGTLRLSFGIMEI